MKKITLSLILFLSSAVIFAQDRPNLIIVMVDQMRNSAMGFWSQPKYAPFHPGKGDPVITPNLDAFADESIVFSKGTPIHPVCSPARGMIWSGTFPRKNGLTQNATEGREIFLKPETKTITDVLFEEGYNTAYFGKAHWIVPKPLFDANDNFVNTETGEGGNLPNRFDSYIPKGEDRHSVEYWLQLVRDDHTNPFVYSSDPEAVNGGKDGDVYKPGIFSTKYETEYLKQYIANTRNQRDESKPFCILWNPNPPHSPYFDIGDVEPEVYNAHYADKKISELLIRDNVTTDEGDAEVKFYFSNVTSVDKYFGDVLKALEDKQIKNNTIVLFTADHGDMMGSHDAMTKNKLWSESLDVPYILRYPDKLDHRIDSLLIGHVDVMPTMLGLMGIQSNLPDMDGKNFAPFLIDPDYQNINLPAASLYIGGKTRGLKTQQYSIEVDDTGSILKLYDNINDPYQNNSLAISSLPPEDQAMIKAELGNWLLIADDQWAEDNTAANFIDYPTTIPTRQIKDSFMELEIEAAQGNQLNLKTTFSKSGDVSITLMNIKGKSQTLFKGFQEKGTAQYAITPFAGSGVYYLFVNAKESKMKVGPLALH